MFKAIFIVGPTASGKTKFAIETAKRFNISICNMDSRQVYKGMEIGTNQGLSDYDELFDNNLSLYLKSIIDPKYNFTLYDYIKRVIPIITKEKAIIFEGGTGLYMDAIINSYRLYKNENSFQLRNKLNKLSINDLKTQVKQIGTYDLLNNSDKNNPRRLIRIIEKNFLRDSSYLQCPNMEFIIFYPIYNKYEICKKIYIRTENMLENGLIQENIKLLENGINYLYNSMQSIGYKEVELFIQDKISRKELANLISVNTCKYVRKQQTWFKRYQDMKEYNLVNFNKIDENISIINKFLL